MTLLRILVPGVNLHLSALEHHLQCQDMEIVPAHLEPVNEEDTITVRLGFEIFLGVC
jgi:hypothetical protein